MELFFEQDEAYRETVLPKAVRSRVAVEALGGMSMYKLVGLDGELFQWKALELLLPAMFCSSISDLRLPMLQLKLNRLLLQTNAEN